MAFSSLLVVALAAQAPAAPPAWKVTSATLFKNGYAVIFREAETDGRSDLILPVLSRGSMGTVWFTASPGVKIKSLTNTTVTNKVQVNASNLPSLLRLNKGKTLTFETFITGDKERQRFRGKIIELLDDQVIVETEDGQATYPLGSFMRILADSGEKILYQSEATTSSRALRFSFQPGAPGKVFVMSLQPGISWTPSYALTLQSETRLKLTAKSVIVNDAEVLSNSEVRLVTGFPHLAFLGMEDPMAQAQALINTLPRGGSGGGLGGPGGPPGAFMNQAVGRFEAGDALSNAFANTGGEGTQAEDLFFYRQTAITLNPGDRGYFVLFESEGDYESIYKCELPNPLAQGRGDIRPEVWHSLEFKNPSGQPLTTAPALTMKDGQVVGQDQMNYTPAAGKASVKVNKTLDILVQPEVEETERERGALKDRFNNPTHDLVTLTGKVEVKNLKSRAVTLSVVLPIEGEAKAPEGTVARQAEGLKQVNPRSLVTWRLPLQPGQAKTLTYSAKVYVGAG